MDPTALGLYEKQLQSITALEAAGRAAQENRGTRLAFAFCFCYCFLRFPFIQET